MATSTRSTPSPPPAGPNSISVSVSHASNGNAQFRSRRGRNSVPAGLTPIRPSLDYSTTNSYLGGESTVGNDTTTDGETFVIQSFGRPRRSSTMSSTASKPTIDINPADTQETRAHRVVPRHGRESPHPQNGANSRGAGPIPMSPHFSYLLPDKLYLGSSINLDARQMSEHSLLSIAVLIAAWQLLTVGESNAAMMLLVLVVCSLVYEYGTPVSTYLFPPKSEPLSPNANGPERPNRRPKVVVTAQHGYIWMTDEKNYRECTDNGESTATLLGPLVVASALFAAKHTIASVPLAANWHMEGPLPLQEQHYSRESLVSSRRGFLQCTFLNTLVLLVHMYSASSRRNWPKPENTPHGGRQVLLFVVFAVCLTAASTAIYEVDRVMQLGFWDGALARVSDLHIALYVSVRLARRALTLGELAFIGHGATALFLETLNISIIKQWPHSAAYVKTFREPSPLLVFQLALLPGSILVGFLLSPLLALSRHIARRPRLRLRAPHQTEQLIYRRMLAIGLAAGAVLLVGGLLGGWVRWLLGARDPWLWVLRSLTQGRRSWSRLTLVSWWGLLGSLSVAGWNRQLARSRRHPHINAYTSVTARPPSQSHFKQKLPPTPTSMSEVSAVGTYPPLVPRLGSLQAQAQSNGFKGTTTLLVPTRDIQAVATDLLDAANKHVPTLSRNGRRKFFHALAVLMFVPGISWDPAFTHLAFSLAFSLFTFSEYVRYFAIYPFGAAVHVFLSEFLDEKDSGSAILSHFYLLTGCALPLWLESPWRVLGLAGVIVLGVGDALASIIGKRLGFSRWFPSSGKTLEGTIAFAVSVFLCNWMVAAQEFTSVNIDHMGCAVIMTALLEAFSKQNDNLTIPLYLWCMMVILPVGTQTSERCRGGEGGIVWLVFTERDLVASVVLVQLSLLPPMQLPPPATPMASFRSSYTHSMMPPAPAPQAATRKRKRPAPNVAFHSVIEDDGRGHQREVVVIEDTPPPAAPAHVPSPSSTAATAQYGHQSAYATRYALAHSYVPPPPSSHVSSTSLAPSPMPLPPRRTRAQVAAASAASSSAIPQLNPPATKRRRKDNTATTPAGSLYETSLAPSVSALPTTGPSSAAFARKALASKAYQNGFNAGTTSIKQWPTTVPSVSTESVRDSHSSQVSNRPPSTVCDDKEGHYIIKQDDIIHSRYRVVRLLGQGTFGKVVEAIDMVHPLYSSNGGRSHLRPNTDYPPNAGRVAIKIIRAVPKYRDASKIEIRVLKRLKESDPQNTRQVRPALRLRHTFLPLPTEIVFITLKHSTIATTFENQFTPFPRRHIQDFARSLLDSVAFLHDLQLIHTDLKPENILLVDSSYDARPMPPGLGRRGQSRHILRNTSIRLIDFGSATFSDEYHSTVVCTRHYRAPEIILGLGWSFPCDAFSLGCILVELYTGVALFQTHDNLEHLAMMEKVMGKMPERLCKQGQRYKPEFFTTTKGAVKLNFPNRGVSAQSKKEVKEVKSLHQIIPNTDIINQDFLDLVQRLLNPDPNTRITVREALKHRYFSHAVPIEW
ncbi:dolichol kinase [Rhizoctonia solani]|uniref:Dolichol kinase n=1 Tax=Rhizoctonia solani TaxID=456999 RepID=A0A8H7LFC6_9AGAM|nr:dolichol kinase [Rhizoctonia solani]